MSNLNKVILIGRITQEFEMQNAGESTVAKVSLATNEKIKGKEYVEFHNLVFWNRLAEIASQFLHRGSLCYVEGKIRTEKWQDQNGNNRYKTTIVVLNLQLLDQNKKSIDSSNDNSY